MIPGTARLRRGRTPKPRPRTLERPDDLQETGTCELNAWSHSEPKRERVEQLTTLALGAPPPIRNLQHLQLSQHGSTHKKMEETPGFIEICTSVFKITSIDWPVGACDFSKCELSLCFGICSTNHISITVSWRVIIIPMNNIILFTCKL